MKLNRKNAGLTLLILGILGIGMGLIPRARLARISYLKSKIPERVYEIDKEMTNLNNDSNSDVRDYWTLLSEGTELDNKTSWFDNVANINKLVEKHNATRNNYKVPGFTGLGLGMIGYFLKREK